MALSDTAPKGSRAKIPISYRSGSGSNANLSSSSIDKSITTGTAGLDEDKGVCSLNGFLNGSMSFRGHGLPASILE